MHRPNGPARDTIFFTTTGGNKCICGGLGPADIPAADMDGNGDPDLLVASFVAEKVQILANQGGARFAAAFSEKTGGGPPSVIAAYLDGDGKIDFPVASSADDDLTIFRGLGGSSFDKVGDVPAGPSPRAMAAVDLNNDSDIDLAVANIATSRVTVLYNNGHWAFPRSTLCGTGRVPPAAGEPTTAHRARRTSALIVAVRHTDHSHCRSPDREAAHAPQAARPLVESVPRVRNDSMSTASVLGFRDHLNHCRIHTYDLSGGEMGRSSHSIVTALNTKSYQCWLLEAAGIEFRFPPPRNQRS